MPNRRRLVLALSTALLVGVGGPVVDVAVKCQRSHARITASCLGTDAEQLRPCPATSEACVWSKALLPVSIGAGLLVLGLPAALLAYWWTGRSSRAAADGV
jgi:hypothetical protein